MAVLCLKRRRKVLKIGDIPAGTYGLRGGDMKALRQAHGELAMTVDILRQRVEFLCVLLAARLATDETDGMLREMLTSWGKGEKGDAS